MRSSVGDGKSSQFTQWVLHLILLTETAKPADFTNTTASSDDLIKLGNFLVAVADSQRRPKLRVVMMRATKSRWVSRPLNDQSASMLPFDHPALTSGHTIFPTTVRTGRDRWALKSAENTAKIGGEILKGKWAGFPAYTLTLEESQTCPTSAITGDPATATRCTSRSECRRGPTWSGGLIREVALLETYHPNGFAVRLHNLGDFYSVEYVELWGRLLDRHPALHCWGYTARWHSDDPIAAALASLVDREWDRFAIRFSNAPSETCSTISVEHPYQVPPDAILCPEQIGKTESCSTCALCWATKRRIAFLQH